MTLILAHVHALEFVYNRAKLERASVVLASFSSVVILCPESGWLADRPGGGGLMLGSIPVFDPGLCEYFCDMGTPGAAYENKLKIGAALMTQSDHVRDWGRGEQSPKKGDVRDECEFHR
ncbi:hypothetical protein L914_19434 [Phytophthora nicotianae]|uniref:Uncharacterized protein n=1 Tax=Phytophthora nicotianae TaxID=4792 RepID=W2MCG4_PHYNI|nr:hypothetical protein L914_19434 [Phytophthora nicotianae]